MESVQKTKPSTTAEFCASARPHRGFTLIEVLAVVAIIAIVGGAGVGIYTGTARRLKVEKAARDFLLMARYARIMAIEKQREYRIQIDEENGGFALSTIEWSEQTEQAEESVVKDQYCKPVEFEGAVRFEDIQVVPTGDEDTAEDEEGKQAIVFRPDGSAQTVVAQIGNGWNNYTISISAATGRAKLHIGKLKEAEIGTYDLDAE